MLRRNPDAIALAVIGLFALSLSVPRMLVRHSDFRVTPLRAELAAQKTEFRAVQAELRSQRDALRITAKSIRNSFR